MCWYTPALRGPVSLAAVLPAQSGAAPALTEPCLPGTASRAADATLLVLQLLFVQLLLLLDVLLHQLQLLLLRQLLLQLLLSGQ